MQGSYFCILVLMNRKWPKISAMFPFGRPALESFAEVLNFELFPLTEKGNRGSVDYRPLREAARSLMQGWNSSGRNFEQMRKKDHSLDGTSMALRFGVVAGAKDEIGLALIDVEGADPMDPVIIAQSIFLRWLFNRDRDLLIGPCPRCDRYFVRKNKRQKVYCSPQCAHGRTSAQSNRRHRDAEYGKTLTTATSYISKWEKSARRVPWKDWVSTRSNISKHWLTRAVNNRRLEEPRA
jgi:hypothetical protein